MRAKPLTLSDIEIWVEASPSDQVAAVLKLCADKLASSVSPKVGKWVSTTEAMQILGLSRDHLRSLRDQGYLKNGVHYRNVGNWNSARPTYQWHPDRMTEALSVPSEQRSQSTFRESVTVSKRIGKR